MGWVHNLFSLEYDSNSVFEMNLHLLHSYTSQNITIIHFFNSDYDARQSRELRRKDAETATNILCEALNWFHMSWTTFGGFPDQIKQRSEKKEHGFTDV